MAVQIVGNGGTVADVDGTVWRAVRVTDRPTEYGAGGYYCVNVDASTAAAPAAAANLVSFRWTSATQLCMIRQISMYLTVTTASTVGVPTLDAYIARSFTASDTGGTAVTISGNAFKKRTSMATSALGDLRFASAAVLTAGTRTLDTQPILMAKASGIALGSNGSALWGIDGPGDHPFILAQNEGLVFQNDVAITTGIYAYSINIHWAEIPAY